jgi:hypothetical protein
MAGKSPGELLEIQSRVIIELPGALFKTKEEAITSIIAIACPHGDTKECREYLKQGLRCQDCKIGNFLRSES